MNNPHRTILSDSVPELLQSDFVSLLGPEELGDTVLSPIRLLHACGQESKLLRFQDSVVVAIEVVEGGKDVFISELGLLSLHLEGHEVVEDGAEDQGVFVIFVLHL